MSLRGVFQCGGRWRFIRRITKPKRFEAILAGKNISEISENPLPLPLPLVKHDSLRLRGAADVV